MYVSGDYVTLHVNGVRYLEKAPLPYWLVASAYVNFWGANEFASRLPMAFSVMLLGLARVGVGTAGIRRAHRHLRGGVRLHLRRSVISLRAF